MSLRLILGSSGSGKSRYIYSSIIESAVQSPEKKFLVIVPEQFTMQTQRELVRLHPDGGLLNIDILSFQRLAHRIFEEVGADKRTVLEELGKTLLLRRAASRRQDELKVLKGNLKKMGYLQQMKSMISELTQYDIDSEKMERLLQRAEQKPSLFYKLKDIQLLYEGFQEELEGKYITAEETLEALCQVARQSEILKGCVVALDGFTGFTPVQNKLLRELFSLAEQVYVTVTIDAREDFYRIRGEHELFYLSKKTIRALTHTAQEACCSILPPVVMEWRTLPRFVKSPELGFLEARLFRSGSRAAQWTSQDANRPSAGETPQDAKQQPAEATARDAKQPPAAESSQDAISLHTAANPVQEAHFAARTIRALLREGYRFQDIAVIVGDMASYSSYIPQVFGEYGIAYFMDSTRTVFSNPLIEFLRAALDMVQQDFTCASVFRYLRTDLCKIEGEKLDMLENYVLAAGVRGFSRWREPFMRTVDFLEEEQLALCEELRAGIMEPLIPFVHCLRTGETTAREKTESLHRLLCHYEIQQQLADMEKGFRTDGQAELEKEFANIYALVIGIFDKLAELLGDELLTLKEYTELLEAGFEEARVRMIPPSADRVQVGDLERTRLTDIRVLFFLGLNDGWVPATGAGGGLLSDLERETLMESKVELAPTARQNSYIQKFYLYLNLTKPQERLYLSCSKATMDGSLLRPSYVMRTIGRLFPELSVQDEDAYDSFADRVETPQNALAYLLEGFGSIREQRPSGEWLELYNWYRRGQGTAEQAQKLVEAAFLTFDGSGIGRQAARELYGEVLVNSVSRLEKFASCAFAHFLQYGLRLQEREEYVFRPVDMGRVFHSAIELYSQKVEESGYNWFEIPEEVRDRFIEEAVSEVSAGYGQQILHDSARNEAMIGRMKRIMRRTVWALHRQIQSGHFYPANFEVSFSQVEGLEAVNIALTPEEKMKLQGRIDRIDVCEKEDQVYVKVIDYKSGNTAFDLVALYYGLQLQLVVYLNAAMELEKRVHPDREIVPAGIFYYHMKDPLLETDEELTPEELNKKLLRQLRPDGLVNKNPAVFQEMDLGIQKSSDVIPVSVNKDGTPSKLSKTATDEQFAALSGFVHRKLREIGSAMLEGEIAPVPYQRKQQKACDYCIYRPVCCLDDKIPGTHTKRLKEYSEQEIWERLNGEGGQK
nr:PD-(D/E)XK nuclease family protein [uncultured Marvinbryantia sp.]